MVILDTMGPLLKGTGHIVRMALLASKFGYLDFTRKSILFPTSLPRRAEPIGVTSTLATLASSAPTPPPGGPISEGHIRGCPIIIRGLVLI